MNSIEVCAAVIINDGRILLATRPPSCELAGLWEFPGGKVEGNEDYLSCIQREIDEELSLCITSASYLTTIKYHYPNKTIHLHFLHCQLAEFAKKPICHDGQQAVWHDIKSFEKLNFAPADEEFITNFLIKKESLLCP